MTLGRFPRDFPGSGGRDFPASGREGHEKPGWRRKRGNAAAWGVSGSVFCENDKELALTHP